MNEPSSADAPSALTNLHVRSAENGDRQAVWLLLNEFAASYTPDADCFHKQYPLLMEAPHIRFFVAVWDKAVVGYTLAFHLSTLYANGTVCEIQELMVAPTHLGRGTGARLVQVIIRDANAAGAREITVPTRRAGEYYRKMGFTESAGYFKRKL